ncbi:MAG TPA: hypothetical protein ENH40_03795 [Nitrospirae bacterium]|nr:hypothetical protein [Nitrospirota bacterium]
MKKTFITLLQLSPVIISMLLIAAHFLRSNSIILVLVSLLLPLLLLVRHPLSARIVQAALALAAIEWVRTLLMIVSVRESMGIASTRLIIILGSVAGFTLLSVLVFFSKSLKERYRLL